MEIQTDTTEFWMGEGKGDPKPLMLDDDSFSELSPDDRLAIELANLYNTAGL